MSRRKKKIDICASQQKGFNLKFYQFYAKFSTFRYWVYAMLVKKGHLRCFNLNIILSSLNWFFTSQHLFHGEKNKLKVKFYCILMQESVSSNYSYLKRKLNLKNLEESKVNHYFHKIRRRKNKGAENASWSVQGRYLPTWIFNKARILLTSNLMILMLHEFMRWQIRDHAYLMPSTWNNKNHLSSLTI